MFLFISKPDFSCNPHALWNYIDKNTDHETAWLVSENKHLEVLRERGIKCELYDTMKGNELVSKAKYIVTNVYVFNALPKKRGQVFVNLWHGSGIKAHDFFDVNLSIQQMNKVLEFSNKTDLMCVHSLDDRFRLSAMLHFDLRKSFVTGQARLDCVKYAKGKENLVKILGDRIAEYDNIIFFVPSFRANSSSHAGKFYSENVFRLDDYDHLKWNDFLEKNNIALVYKLHPIEQTALKGVSFEMGSHCYELTDEMLFYSDVRYNEILNAFDILISDYSSIVFDYLLLDRPVIYLVPDYEEYQKSKGFVFHNIEYYMPGEKVKCFHQLLKSIEVGLTSPDIGCVERKRVLEQRFDFQDCEASKRCYETIINYKDINEQKILPLQQRRMLPSSTEMIKRYIPKDIFVVDSLSEAIEVEEEKPILYITEEVPDENRSISKRASTDILDLSFYYKIKTLSTAKVGVVSGGVDNEHFDLKLNKEYRTEYNDKKIIGFAGTIDCRIYFAMVQYICEAFPNCEIVFYGDIFGEYPAWLDGYDNLHYMGQISYEELPEKIATFDVAILPFYGEYQQRVPNELFQYLACGKIVVASDMENLPKCPAIFRSKSVSEAVLNVKKALSKCNEREIIAAAKAIAKERDWKVIAEELLANT